MTAESGCKLETKLKEYGFPLDLRDNKFFSGGAWDGFCNGDKKSPGGPKAIAEFLLIMLDDLKTRGVEVDGDEVDAAPIAAPAPAPAQTSASGRNARIATSAMAAPAASSSVERDQDELSYTESFVERQFFAEHAGATDSLKAKYGNWATPAIRTALAFDAYFSWYYAWRNKVPLDAPQEDKETRALENMHLAVDMHEMFERVSLSRHGSFMPHAAIYKITQSILEVGDVEAFDTSPLEMQNAESRDQAQGPQHWRHQQYHDSRGRVAAWTAQERGTAGAPYKRPLKFKSTGGKMMLAPHSARRVETRRAE